MCYRADEDGKHRSGDAQPSACGTSGLLGKQRWCGVRAGARAGVGDRDLFATHAKRKETEQQSLDNQPDKHRAATSSELSVRRREDVHSQHQGVGARAENVGGEAAAAAQAGQVRQPKDRLRTKLGACARVLAHAGAA